MLNLSRVSDKVSAFKVLAASECTRSKTSSELGGQGYRRLGLGLVTVGPDPTYSVPKPNDANPNPNSNPIT